MGIAIFSFWRHPKRAAIAVALALSILLLGSNTLLARGLVRSLEQQFLPPTPIPQAEAIVILGGCTRSDKLPRPWIEISEAGDRLLYGAKLYREGYAPWVVLAGGRIDWQHPGAAESEDMSVLIQSMGVPEAAILQERHSLNTLENAVNVMQLLKKQNINGSVLLVTSALHMPRAIATFHHLGVDAIATPTDFHVAETGYQPSLMVSLLEMIPSVEALELTTQALKEYLGWSIYKLRGWL